MSARPVFRGRAAPGDEIRKLTSKTFCNQQVSDSSAFPFHNNRAEDGRVAKNEKGSIRHVSGLR